MSEGKLLQAIAVVAELTGTELTRAALLAMESDLSGYPEHVVMNALNRCRKELKGRLTPAAVIERIESQDGRPTANEAWAIALCYFDETKTVVINEEIQAACAAVRPIMESGDEVAARMAFRDAYDRIVAEARAAGRFPTWMPSLGSDKEQMRLALTVGVERGLLTQQAVAGLLPAPIQGDGAVIAGLLEGKVVPMSEQTKARFDGLRAILRGEAKAPQHPMGI